MATPYRAPRCRTCLAFLRTPQTQNRFYKADGTALEAGECRIGPPSLQEFEVEGPDGEPVQAVSLSSHPTWADYWCTSHIDAATGASALERAETHFNAVAYLRSRGQDPEDATPNP